MTNFATRWRKPERSKPEPRQYLNEHDSPLTTCEFHSRGKWLLTFKDGSSRLTSIRPTSEMVAIHNRHLARNASKRAFEALIAD